MVNQQKHVVEYNDRKQRIEKSLKSFVLVQRKKRAIQEEDPLDGILQESMFISNEQTELLSHQYCLPTPKSLLSQMIVENYDHDQLENRINPIDNDMNELKGRLDSIIASFEKLSFEKDINREDEPNTTQFDGVNFEINNQLKKYKSNFENKRLSKFLSCDKNQKTIFDFIKPSHKRKPDEPKLSEDQSNLKKQKLISEYTCHQSGEEMFEILDRSIERKKQYLNKKEPEVKQQYLVEVIDESQEVSSSNSHETHLIDNSKLSQSSSIPVVKISETIPTNQPIENKPKTYMERIKDHAKLFHSKHPTKSTLTIKKKEKPKTRDILKEEDDFSLLQVDSSTITSLFSY